MMQNEQTEQKQGVQRYVEWRGLFVEQNTNNSLYLCVYKKPGLLQALKPVKVPCFIIVLCGLRFRVRTCLKLFSLGIALLKCLKPPLVQVSGLCFANSSSSLFLWFSFIFSSISSINSLRFFLTILLSSRSTSLTL